MALIFIGAKINRSGKRYRLEAEYTRWVPTRGMRKGYYYNTLYVAHTDGSWMYDKIKSDITDTMRKDIGSWIRFNADYKIINDGTKVNLK